MLRLSASLLLLFANTFTLAQASNDPTVAPKDALAAAKDSAIKAHMTGCPIGFTANRQAPVQMMSADEARRLGPTMQSLHLTLRRLKSQPAIESIEVTVYGTSQKGLVLPVDPQATNAISKTFTLRRTSEDASLSDADVSMNLVGSLTRADLNAITYADGSTWHATPELKCRAVPSNFLLVGTR